MLLEGLRLIVTPGKSHMLPFQKGGKSDRGAGEAALRLRGKITDKSIRSERGAPYSTSDADMKEIGRSSGGSRD